MGGDFGFKNKIQNLKFQGKFSVRDFQSNEYTFFRPKSTLYPNFHVFVALFFACFVSFSFCCSQYPNVYKNLPKNN